MINISHDTYYDDHILECTGHADYAKEGKDILCAAVTILCYTVADYLQEAAQNGIISDLLCDISKGYANIRFNCKRNSEAEKCFFALTRGFRILSDNFPDNIIYEE